MCVQRGAEAALLLRQREALAPAAMSSYYNNGPRIFTPSTLKTSTQFKPIESFGVSTAASLPSSPMSSPGAEAPPDAINTCHRSRGTYLQHSHPRKLPETPPPTSHHDARTHSPSTHYWLLTGSFSSCAGTYALLRQAEAVKTASTLEKS